MRVGFRDRVDAGRALADRLRAYSGQPNLLVLALPRGGVPVAYEVARALGAQLDVFTVRKLGVPDHEELAMGAIATGDVRVLNWEVVRGLGISEAQIEQVAVRERRELMRREQAFRGDRPPPQISGRTVILVDDGLATGSTMRAAVLALKQQQPGQLVVGVPIAARETCSELQGDVDDMVCVLTPEPFVAVGMWYEDFSETTDQEILILLERAERELRSAGRPDLAMRLSFPANGQPQDVQFRAGLVDLDGILTVPAEARGVAVFAHGSGSSRFSRRNQFVAEELNHVRLATLLMDLLTYDEQVVDERTGHLRFDVDLLAGRLQAASRWLADDPELAQLGVGYFGASTGAAAALIAAARDPEAVQAVVSRGGRPDLAASALRSVQAPTLLIVGGADHQVLQLNTEALLQIPVEKQLEVVPGATHLFEEPGTLEQAARLATRWFVDHLHPRAARRAA